MSDLRFSRISSSGSAFASRSSTMSIACGIFSLRPFIVMWEVFVPERIEKEHASEYILEAISSALIVGVPR